MRAHEFISEKKLMSKKDDPCQPGYRMLGMKNKGGRKVPNCIPETDQGVAEGPIGKAVGATVGAVTGAAVGTIGAAVTGKPSKIYKGAKKGAKLGKKALGWA